MDTYPDTPPLRLPVGSNEVAKLQLYKLQLDHLLAHTHPDTLASGESSLVCDNEEEVRYMRLLLDQRGLSHVGVKRKPKPLANRLARQRVGYKARR